MSKSEEDKTVLIVEDDETLQQTLVYNLEQPCWCMVMAVS